MEKREIEEENNEYENSEEYDSEEYDSEEYENSEEYEERLKKEADERCEEAFKRKLYWEDYCTFLEKKIVDCTNEEKIHLLILQRNAAKENYLDAFYDKEYAYEGIHTYPYDD